jgi:hypothetical protein
MPSCSIAALLLDSVLATVSRRWTSDSTLISEAWPTPRFVKEAVLNGVQGTEGTCLNLETQHNKDLSCRINNALPQQVAIPRMQGCLDLDETKFSTEAKVCGKATAVFPIRLNTKRRQKPF